MPAYPETYLDGAGVAQPMPAPQWDGFGVTYQDAVLRSQMDTGPGKVRRRFSAVSRQVSTRWVFHTLQMYAFRAWYSQILKDGSLSFDWYYPVTNALVRARFKTSPNYKPVGSPMTLKTANHGAGEFQYLEGLWEVTAELEVLP